MDLLPDPPIDGRAITHLRLKPGPSQGSEECASGQNCEHMTPEIEMQLTGALLIGGRHIRKDSIFQAEDPATGEKLGPQFSIAGDDHAAEAARLAAECCDE